VWAEELHGRGIPPSSSRHTPDPPLWQRGAVAARVVSWPSQRHRGRATALTTVVTFLDLGGHRAVDRFHRGDPEPGARKPVVPIDCRVLY
jgi:hypothetical protein